MTTRNDIDIPSNEPFPPLDKTPELQDPSNREKKTVSFPCPNRSLLNRLKHNVFLEIKETIDCEASIHNCRHQTGAAEIKAREMESRSNNNFKGLQTLGNSESRTSIDVPGSRSAICERKAETNPTTKPGLPKASFASTKPNTKQTFPSTPLHHRPKPAVTGILNYTPQLTYITTILHPPSSSTQTLIPLHSNNATGPSHSKSCYKFTTSSRT
jgi:hypothetical protein